MDWWPVARQAIQEPLWLSRLISREISNEEKRQFLPQPPYDPFLTRPTQSIPEEMAVIGTGDIGPDIASACIGGMGIALLIENAC